MSDTLISISSILPAARMIGRPTTEGNVCNGKLDPAYPHLTNLILFWKKNRINQIELD